MYTVYAIRVPTAGKAYFGSTRNLARRGYTHRSMLKAGKHHNLNLQAWFNLVGMEGLVFETLAQGLEKSAAHALEERLLVTAEALNIGLKAVGGDNLTRNPKASEIVKRRTAAQRKMLNELSEAERHMLWGQPGKANGMWGHTHTAEVRLAASCRAKGNKYALGAIRSPEHRAALSQMASLRVGELNPFYGRTHTDEHKNAAHLRMLGKKPTNSRPVICDGVKYLSATEAGRCLGVVTATILFRIKSKHWNYHYA